MDKEQYDKINKEIDILIGINLMTHWNESHKINAKRAVKFDTDAIKSDTLITDLTEVEPGIFEPI